MTKGLHTYPLRQRIVWARGQSNFQACQEGPITKGELTTSNELVKGMKNERKVEESTTPSAKKGTTVNIPESPTKKYSKRPRE